MFQALLIGFLASSVYRKHCIKLCNFFILDPPPGQLIESGYVLCTGGQYFQSGLVFRQFWIKLCNWISRPIVLKIFLGIFLLGFAGSFCIDLAAKFSVWHKAVVMLNAHVCDGVSIISYCYSKSVLCLWFLCCLVVAVLHWDKKVT